MDYNSYIILMKKTSSERHCFIFSNIYQNNDNIGSGFPPTSGQMPPTSGSSDWLNWDPHMVYTHPEAFVMS